jgi:hypothetical protein
MSVAYITKAEFARANNWAASYVTELRKTGRLVLSPDGQRVNAVASLDLIERTRSRPKPPKGETEDAPGGTSDYWSAKTEREQAMADLAKLELARKRGDLVVREDVERMAFATARVLRDGLMGLPVRIIPDLLTTTDPFAAEVKLRDAIRQILASHSKTTATELLRLAEDE